MDELLTRLAKLDSCAVSDALDKLGLPGAVGGIGRLTTLRRIAGRVHTVRMDRDDGTPATRHLGTTAIEASMPGEVIFMVQRTGVEAACWGGNLSFGAKLRQVAGIAVTTAIAGTIAVFAFELALAAGVLPWPARSRALAGASAWR